MLLKITHVYKSGIPVRDSCTSAVSGAMQGERCDLLKVIISKC